MTAEVIPIRPNRRYCSSCVNGYSGSLGLYCGEYDEFIQNEAIATTCEAYEAEKTVPKGLASAKKRHPSNHLQVVDPKPPKVVQATVSSPPQPPWRPTREDAIAYLKGLHTVLWGIQLDVTKPTGRDQAADWIVELYERIAEDA